MSQKNKKEDKSLDSTKYMDLSLKKEYALYSDAYSTDIHTLIDTQIEQSKQLQLNTYQSFIRNLFDPLSDYKSLFLIHGTGTGKTITSLSVAIEYQKQYREFMSLEKNKVYDDIHSIIIVGYTKDIFKDELISHPEFGFVSKNEIKELRDYQNTAHESKIIEEKLNNLKNKFYRRITDREMNGIFKFYGYRQLFNRIINLDDLSEKIKSNKLLEKKVDQIDNEDEINSNIDPVQIRKWIRDGSIRLNKSFIETLKKSLIICDEVHNLYYYNDLNAYGLIIEIINDYFTEPKLYNPNWSSDNEYCIRWLFLSATPLASSPTEIIPIINLLNNKANRVEYSDLFNSDTKELTSKGLDLISRRVDGHISYIMDDNPIQYPASEFVGTTIKGISYLKFIQCPMSKEHLDVYNKYIKNNSYNIDGDSEQGNRSNTLKDFVFKSSKANELLYRYNEVKDQIKSNNSPYKEDSNGFLMSETFNINTLGTYSNKYYQVMKYIYDLKSEENGKIFIYHPYVQSTGVNLLTSIFKANGLLENNDLPNDNSICMRCDLLFKFHKCKIDEIGTDACEFIPIRFIVITGYISKSTAANRLAQYNSNENLSGSKFKILLGSKAMRESHTLKACRHLMVVHQPASVSELIQIIGRGVRKNSHSLLPANKRNIKLYIFVSSMSNKLSMEEINYCEKMKLYKQILIIENILFNQSLDYLINFRFKRREVPKLIGDAFILNEKISTEYNTMKTYPITRLGSIRSNTFYFSQETSLCTYLIKRILFEYQPIILKSKLIELIRAPPFSVEADIKLISNEAIEYVLNNICYDKNSSLIIDNTNKENNFIESLFNDSKIIMGPNNKQFYIKCELVDKKSTDLLLYIDSVSNPISDLHKLITLSEPVPFESQINLETLSNNWNELVAIDEIIMDIQNDYLKNKTILGAIVHRIDQFTVETHTKLIEYCILAIISKIFINKKLTINPNLLIEIVDYYQNINMLITIKNTTNTIISSLYKKYLIQTGSTWQEIVISNKQVNNRINYSTIPIGHYTKFIARIISPETIANPNSIPIWNEYSTIIQSKKWTYPYNLYAYDERGTNIHSIFKIKDLTNAASKGINPMFLQQKDLLVLAKRLGLKVNNNDKKTTITKNIKNFMIDTEDKYRTENSNKKIFFYSYEMINDN